MTAELASVEQHVDIAETVFEMPSVFEDDGARGAFELVATSLSDDALTEFTRRISERRHRLYPVLKRVAEAELRRRNVEPQRFDDPPMPFPVGALPDILRTFVNEVSEALDSPAEFTALPLLAIVGGLLGPRVRIQLKRGWDETAQLWLVTVARTGTGKTPALQKARGPLDDMQSKAHEDYQLAKKQYDADLAEWNRQPEGQRGPRPNVPRMVHYYTSNVTLEAQAAMLAINPSLSVLADEVLGWIASHDAYRKGGDRQAALSLWSAEPIKIDRKTSEPIFVKRPVVPIYGGIQPEMLPQLADEAHRGDGFIERILWSYPSASIPGWSEAEVSQDVVDGIAVLFKFLRALPDESEPVRLDAEAKKLFTKWYGTNALWVENAPATLAGIYAKLPVQLARLALILHVTGQIGQSINSTFHRIHPSILSVYVDGETMERAIALVEYFRAHAHLVMRELGTVTANLTPERQAILSYHQQHGPATSQQVADILQLNMKSVNNMQQALVKRGLLAQPQRGVYDIAPVGGSAA